MLAQLMMFRPVLTASRCIIRPLPRLCLRRAHSATPEWPAGRNPSPYDIFGMTPATFDKKAMNRTYIQLAKIYHPDVQNDNMPSTLRNERFKQLVSAHDILKDDKERKLWEIRNNRAGHQRDPSYYYSPDVAQRYRSEHETHNDENWEKQTDAQFEESLRQNRWWLLKWICFIVFVVGAGEIQLLFSAARNRSADLDKMSEEVRGMHYDALLNYDRGDSYEDRIRRFVEHRQRTLDRNANRSYAGIIGRPQDAPTVHSELEPDMAALPPPHKTQQPVDWLPPAKPNN